MARSPITTHVLDTHRGRPAVGVGVRLERLHGPDAWRELARSATNEDGRCEDLLPPGSHVEAGTYRLTFETGHYFAGAGFHPFIPIVFEIVDPMQHHHVPLLLAAHGYTTYRGS
jgi:5-hydroxyisourate hydrolase